MKSFTIWYAGMIIGNVNAMSATTAAKYYKSGTRGSVVAVLDRASQQEHDKAKLASMSEKLKPASKPRASGATTFKQRSDLVHILAKDFIRSLNLTPNSTHWVTDRAASYTVKEDVATVVRAFRAAGLTRRQSTGPTSAITLTRKEGGRVTVDVHNEFTLVQFRDL
jgi:hypothetical protein